jgi:glycosyltransferase involved in cell wall biosynthesis
VDNDDVTAVIACFNYGRYLGEAVASARGQGARVIVVDDGSTEPETHSTLDELEADDVLILRQHNQGVCRARNAGLALVTTRYVVVLDADDRLAEGALAAMRAPLDANPSLGFAYGWMRFMGQWEGVLRFPPYDPYRLLHRHMIGLSALARRDVFEDTGGFDPAFEEFEDWDLWLSALGHGWRGHRVEHVTLDYRRHAGASKLNADRRGYRRAYANLRRKHAPLYARAGELAREGGVGPRQRALYRWFWGARPVPAGLEALVHRRLFRAQAGTNSG